MKEVLKTENQKNNKNSMSERINEKWGERWMWEEAFFILPFSFVTDTQAGSKLSLCPLLGMQKKSKTA
ncbi:hypothetical protein GXP67_33695 [Rhodocytophaga rosea]|uniref:Uncharacterized protein n=1 Tax=Rhodocytophaga rosea TaxID=2704465 RepID=A0A6C0GSY1_9BACT|nr:hypothetical protein [Rhodocytophaga rosea]QHT71258.1 hypothetical protein GXP67_33695 [Rhodocytophaga rosea]